MSVADRLTQQLSEKNPEFKEVWKDPERQQQFDLSCRLVELLFNVLGSFAQFEADLVRERTTEGRERAKAVQQALQLFQNRATNNMSVNDIVKVTGVPRSTIYAKRLVHNNGKMRD